LPSCLVVVRHYTPPGFTPCALFVRLHPMADPAALDAMVAEACSGHKDALAALYREFHGALVGFLFGLVAAEAEDLAAETWIDMAQALPTFRGDGVEFRRLLFTIARRRAVDHGRKRRRRRTDPVDLHQLPLRAMDADPAATVAQLDASRRAIRQIAELLPGPQAEVVLLRVVAGLSVAETARVLGRSANAVSVLQNRGLRRLASTLEVTRAPSGRATEGNSKKRTARFRGVERWDG
jgi:RNA polymerase sigma-70 factor, ECF subfamily